MPFHKADSAFPLLADVGLPPPELVVEIVPTPQLRSSVNAVEFIRNEIGRRFFVTPTKTIARALESEPFFKFTIDIIDAFPPEGKMVKLKKVQS